MAKYLTLPFMPGLTRQIRTIATCHVYVQVMSECDAVMADLKKSYGVDSFGAIGFCWGGLYAVKLNGGFQSLVCPACGVP